MTAHARMIDTFEAFLAFWHRAQNLSVEQQIEEWINDYMAPWPELLQKQLDDYASACEDWRCIARKRVFPFLGNRLPAMRSAHSNLLALCDPILTQAQEALGLRGRPALVIYVGIGCGAGWVTTYEGSPAILFGLENVAECGWTEPPALSGLIAHEIGHLFHSHLRAQQGIQPGSGPWWQLYEEGFAQRCEHHILGTDGWHMAAHDRQAWLAWCRMRQSWLAAEFLRAADAGESVRPFFGSWYDIEGHSQTGYFLGHALIRELEADLALETVALLKAGDPRLRASLEKLAFMSGGSQ